MLKMGEHWCEHPGCMSWGTFGYRGQWFCKEHKDLKHGKPAPSIRSAYVRGRRVALRSKPAKDSQILDRLNIGNRIEVLGMENEWSRVRDPLTRRTGWIASYLLADNPVLNADEAKPEKSKPKLSKPPISDSAIVKAIIAASISGYSGSCPCPYNRDRGGRSCGKRSAYSKPGGASPICFVSDVSADMIEAWRKSQN